MLVGTARSIIEQVTLAQSGLHLQLELGGRQRKCGLVYILMPHLRRRYRFSKTDWKLAYFATAVTITAISQT